MNNYIRPQIQNGPIAKRTQPTHSVRPAPKAVPRATSAVLTQLTPAWSVPNVEVGALKQRGLSLLALDEELRSTATTKAVAQEKAASRSSVMVGLLCCGALLAGGFMYSLRERFTAHAVSRDEIELKDKTTETKARNQRLRAEVEHAASPEEIDREARKASGLAPLEFDQKKIASGAKKVTTAEKAKPQTSPQPQARLNRH